METDLIFAFGFGNTTPDAGEYIEKIKNLNGKSIGWWELEAQMALIPRFNAEDKKDCLGIQEWEDPRILNCPLSGPLSILTKNKMITSEIFSLTSQGYVISFHSLRKAIWSNSGGESWLNLEIKWDINKFIGILSVLDSRMRPAPTSF